MKWLFATLVALNIIVFGAMLVSRMIAPQPQVVNVPSAQPTIVQIQTGDSSNGASRRDAPAEPRANTARTTRPAPARAAANPASKNTTTQAAPSSSDIRSPNVNCTATITIPEDDYYRIRGLLTKWPHAASRVVVRRDNNGRAANTKYQVVVAIEGEASAFAQRLKSMGFTPHAAGGRMNLGTFSNEQQAQALMSKAQQSGLTPLLISTGMQGGQSLSEAKMQLVFANVDEAAATGINGVVGRYGTLRRASCSR